MPKRPTSKDFETFKREFLRCISLLELGEWKIFFEFTKLDEDNYAEIEWASDQYTATVRFNKCILTGMELQHFDPKRSARHEASHLFTARLASLGRDRYVMPDQFHAELERMARVLEKIL